jgi:hypothetical protein
MIARHYDPSDKMMGKYAAYYLLPEGVKALRKKDRLSPAVVKHIGKDAKATEHQINRFLNVAKVYCDLRDAYGDKVEVRTASDLAGSGPRINQLPDALVKLRTESGIASFYLAVHNSTVSVKETSRKLSQYSKDDLEDFLGVNGFSGVLSICETSQLQRQIENRNNLFSFEFLVTSLESLLRIKENDSIWHRPGKSERAVSLASL